MYSGIKYASTTTFDETPVKSVPEVSVNLPQSASFADLPHEKFRRSDWLANHLLIQEAIMYLMKKLGRPASNLELAEATGLSERTVRYHLENIDMTKLFDQVRRKYAPLAEEIMLSLIKSARRGSSRAQQLYFELIFGWRPGQTVEIEMPKRMEEDIERLSQDALSRARQSQLVTSHN